MLALLFERMLCTRLTEFDELWNRPVHGFLTLAEFLQLISALLAAYVVLQAVCLRRESGRLHFWIATALALLLLAGFRWLVDEVAASGRAFGARIQIPKRVAQLRDANSSPQERWEAAYWMGLYGPRARQAVIHDLTLAMNDPGPLVRAAAARSLSRIGGPPPGAIPRLTHRVTGRTNASERAGAAQALGALGPYTQLDVMSSLQFAVDNDIDASVRAAALKAIKVISGK